jgi:hypothetical protein
VAAGVAPGVLPNRPPLGAGVVVVAPPNKPPPPLVAGLLAPPNKPPVVCAAWPNNEPGAVVVAPAGAPEVGVDALAVDLNMPPPPVVPAPVPKEKVDPVEEVEGLPKRPPVAAGVEPEDGAEVPPPKLNDMMPGDFKGSKKTLCW